MTAHLTIMNDLSCGERLAVWTLRRLAGPPRPTGRAQAGLFMPCFRRDFDDVTAAFRAVGDRMAALKVRMPDIGMPGAQALSTTETRFLDAIAAAQAGEDTSVLRLLRRVAPCRPVLAPLASAITLLGACLAGAGHWLPRRNGADETPPSVRDDDGRGDDLHGANRRPTDLIGAGCLTVLARWHDLDMGRTHVMWPRAVLPPIRRAHDAEPPGDGIGAHGRP
jgi:hypothetical protein